MSDIAAAIRDHLEGVSAVTDLVSTRIRKRFARSSDFRDSNKNLQPYITIAVISDPQDHYQGGNDGLSQARLQINCNAGSSGLANLISAAVKAALDGLTRQTMGDANLDVRSVSLEDGPVDDDQPASDGSQEHVFSDRMDFLAWHA